jgi:hypothetical protein
MKPLAIAKENFINAGIRAEEGKRKDHIFDRIT